MKPCIEEMLLHPGTAKRKSTLYHNKKQLILTIQLDPANLISFILISPMFQTQTISLGFNIPSFTISYFELPLIRNYFSFSHRV